MLTAEQADVLNEARKILHIQSRRLRHDRTFANGEVSARMDAAENSVFDALNHAANNLHDPEANRSMTNFLVWLNGPGEHRNV